jgi:hypothetical protein
MTISILHDEAVSPNLARRDPDITCAYAQTTLLDDDSIVCLYRQGTTKHSPDGILVLQRSVDLGRTWSEPQTVFDGTSDNPRETVVSAGICAMRHSILLVVFGSALGLSGSTYLFSEAGQKLPRRIRGCVSADSGRTWNAMPALKTGGFRRAGIAGSPFLLPDRSVGIPIEVALASGVQGTALARWVSAQQAVGPPDLSESVLIAGDPTGIVNLCDAHFAVLPDGQVLMLLWTFLKDGERTIHVHRSVSSDNGSTWSEPEPTVIEGQVTVPLALPSGLLIAAANYRRHPEGVYLWTSTDNGRTWGAVPPVRLWDERSKQIEAKQEPWQHTLAAAQEGVWAELDAFTFGTPDLALLQDGSILLTYYATLHDVTHIRACRFRLD